uniref:Uncharacterized protein LOC111107990 n=1 Tax=Crassostrea virginica TaxID=6565 RepID=A0A8B8B6Y1_CRAVI|nr:uncharacterized protein LOC111107990 [Crassostrea virginica]
MATGKYGYLLCVLCIWDVLYMAHALCRYMKQDVAYKVVESDLVLTGTVRKIMEGDSKYFPGVNGAKTIEMDIECIYKGPDMTTAAKIYGAGVFEDTMGKCHNTTVAVDTETIVYVQKMDNGDLMMKFVNDPIYYTDEINVCGVPRPKLVTDHTEPDYADEICPWYEEDCIRYVTTKAPTTMAPTPEPTPEPTVKPEEPKSTIKYDDKTLQPVKPQVKDNDDSGVASLTSVTSILVISSLLAYLAV